MIIKHNVMLLVTIGDRRKPVTFIYVSKICTLRYDIRSLTFIYNMDNKDNVITLVQ